MIKARDYVAINFTTISFNTPFPLHLLPPANHQPTFQSHLKLNVYITYLLDS